jgi:DNA-binding NtrC family response regulator
MKVLIIEDDEYKRRWLEEAVSNSVPDANIETARSVNTGLASVERFRPDALLLDMSLTTFDIGPDEPGGRPQNFGGLEVLRQMDRLDIVVPTVVITQHERFESASGEVAIDVLGQELAREFKASFRGLIYYNTSQGAWKVHLKRILRQLSKEKRRG